MANFNETIPFNCLDSGCNGLAGVCIQETLSCVCREGWVAPDCSIFFYEYDQGIWAYYIFHLVFFSVCFVGIAIWASIAIKNLFKGSNYKRKDVNRHTLTLFILVGFLGFQRAFYLALYQYGRVLEVPEMVGNILFGLCISNLIFIQLYVCNLWIAAYLKTKPRMANVLKKIRFSCDFVGIGFFLFQLIYNIVMALPQVDLISKVGLQIAYFVIVLLVMGVSTVFLLIFGVKLRNQLKLFKDVDQNRKKVIRKINRFGIIISVIMIIIFIVLVGFILVGTQAGDDVATSVIFIIFQEVVLRCVELAYCIAVLVTYQKNVKHPLSSSSGHTSTGKSRRGSATFRTDVDSHKTHEDNIVSTPIEATPMSDIEAASPSD